MSRDFDAGPRVRANNFFDIGVVGRRTGIAMKANVKKDADGLDNIDDFWDDSDDNGATDNNKNGTQDYAQEAFSGEDYQDEEEEERHPLPPTRRSDPRLYLQQEAPEELLLTPTSRRSRGSSKGTLTGESSMYGSHLYTGAEESPSIDKVRKRLVFTKDFSDDDEAEQTPAPRTQSNKPSSGSPALDKILNDSQQRKANMSKSVGRDSSSAPKDKAPAKAPPAKAPPAKVAPTKAPPAKAKQTTTQPSTAAASTKRSAHFPKAFDLGGDFNGEDEFALPVHNNTNFNLSDPDDDQRPPLAAAAKSKAGRTQSEPKLKSKVAPARLMLSDDDLIHEEPETRPEDDDRLMFSDEDGPSRFNDDGSEDEEEALQDNRRKMDAIARKKRTTSTVEPVSVSKGGKQAAGATRTVAKQKNIPKKVDFSKTAQQKQRRHEDEDGMVEDDEVEEVSSEDHREVPSMQRSGAKERPSAGSNKSNSRRKVDNGLESKQKIREDKTTTHEIPIVPEEKPEEGAGVRRSTRTKVAPLEFWKNEKLVFEKAVDEGVAGPVIKAVLRAQTEEGDPALRRKMPTKAGKKRKYTPRSETSAPPTRRQRTDRDEEEQEGTQGPHPDDSMDEEQVELATKGVREEFKQSAEILVYGSDDVVSRVVAESQSSIQFRNVQSGEYQFHRGLEDTDTVVSGTMKIKPDGRKPVNSGSNTSMVFYVIKGLVQVKVHETQFVLSTGGRFLVPRGNTYSIVNLSTKESTLFFVQTKPPRLETTDTSTASSSAAATSTTTAGSSSNQTKKTAGDQSGPDNSDSDSSPPAAAGKKISSAAPSSSKSPSPPPATTSVSNNNNNKNRRRSPSVRQSLSKTSAAAFVGSPSPPPSSSSMATAEATSKSSGVNRQPSVRPSVFR
ncbi:MAG: hypothetical protein J3R72DRAFT_520163 [Linnemannia gamsii]|nr:MAG: hypothetical protein J3R72DRAFT_520163 [Linnemannia gamsii]